MSDIECPRCHRISFAWESCYSCEQCHWPIRPLVISGPAYGFDVLIEVQGRSLRLETVEKHYKGTESRVRSRAKTVAGFRRVLAVVPYDEATWIRSYGEGRM
jgi:hypothetical protein